jgi:hypothetical protein
MEYSIIDSRIDNYPQNASAFATQIRELIHQTAHENSLGDVEESLKWGEPSFKTRHGSPVRMDWKASSPGKFYIFVNCKTILVETYREIYGSVLSFEGTRAIVLELGEPVPEKILKHCIYLALNYHRLKKLPMLGV